MMPRPAVGHFDLHDLKFVAGNHPDVVAPAAGTQEGGFLYLELPVATTTVCDRRHLVDRQSRRLPRCVGDNGLEGEVQGVRHHPGHLSHPHPDPLDAGGLIRRDVLLTISRIP